MPVQHRPLPLCLDRRLQRVALLLGVVVVRVVVLVLLRELWSGASSVDREDRLATFLQNFFHLTVAVIVELKPVLGAVVLHEVAVGVEEDAPVVVDAGDPDWQDGGLHPRPETKLVCQIFIGLPDEQSHLVAASDSNFSFSILQKIWHHSTGKTTSANLRRSSDRPRHPVP